MFSSGSAQALGVHVLKAECQCCCVDCRFTHVPVSLSHYHSTTGSSHINDLLVLSWVPTPACFRDAQTSLPIPTLASRNPTPHSLCTKQPEGPIKSQQGSSLRHYLTWLPFHCCPRRIHFFLNFFSKIYKDFKYCYDYLLFDFEYFYVIFMIYEYFCACSYVSSAGVWGQRPPPRSWSYRGLWAT